MAMTSLQVTAGAVPAPVCVPVNGVLHLTADPSSRQPWGPLTSSEPKILTCTSQPGAEGSVDGVCRPHLPGTVTVSALLTGDGRPPFRWELRVTVVAYGLN
jgi:hypothetical protein